MEAKNGVKASWAWASILEGRDFFKENTKWQIMNGEEVEFWKDKWIEGVCLEEYINNEQEEHQKVAEFINKEGRWRVEQIKRRLGEEIIKEIEVVPICRNAEKDRIVWPSTKDGKYSVKARYHIIKKTMKEVLTKKASLSHHVEEKV